MGNTVHLPFFYTLSQPSTYGCCWRQTSEISGLVQNCNYDDDDDYDGVSKWFVECPIQC